jgi:hypothetical protein
MMNYFRLTCLGVRFSIPGMNISAQLIKAEAQLKKAGISVSQFCRRIDLDRSNWQRWKDGKHETTEERWLGIKSQLDRELAKK